MSRTVLDEAFMARTRAAMRPHGDDLKAELRAEDILTYASALALLIRDLDSQIERRANSDRDIDFEWLQKARGFRWHVIREQAFVASAIETSAAAHNVLEDAIRAHYEACKYELAVDGCSPGGALDYEKALWAAIGIEA